MAKPLGFDGGAGRFSLSWIPFLGECLLVCFWNFGSYLALVFWVYLFWASKIFLISFRYAPLLQGDF